MSRTVTFAQAVLEATDQILERDKRAFLMGLGVPDPKGIFGTTLGLQEKHGKERVLDMPVAENGMTGIAIGAALRGLRPILTHQRVDFTLLSLDQIINNASKWKEMFSTQTIPLVIRAIIGRGWGQGPQHCQTLHGLFAHIPGLKVVMPATPMDAKGLMISAFEDPHPVIYLEHRWLHGVYGVVSEEYEKVPLGKAKCVREGTDLTIIASSLMTIEALKCAQLLEQEKISAEIIDLRSIKPLDDETIFQSVRKTKKVLVLDPDWQFSGFSGEICTRIVQELWGELQLPPHRLTYPDRHCSTSWALANYFYPTHEDIAAKVFEMLGRKVSAKALLDSLIDKKFTPQDTPDASFKGPF